MAVATYTKTGTKSSTSITLDKSIFSLKVENLQLLKQAAITASANARTNLAQTKKRGEVRGGGRKPWRQKGTGRARFGSIRNPIWRGGGIVFGPSNSDNYTKQMSQKSRRQALKQALSLAVDSNRVSVIEVLPTTKKTGELSKVLGKANFTSGLLVSDKPDNNVAKTSANLANISFTTVDKLAAADVLNSSAILFEKSALAALVDRLKD